MNIVVGKALAAAAAAAFAIAPCVAPARAAEAPPRTAAGAAATPAPAAAQPGSSAVVSLTLRETPLQEVFHMLSRHQRVNIVLGKGVTGTVSINLYDVDVGSAIHTIANAAGYAVQVRNGDYMIVERKEADLDRVRAPTQVRSFKVQYSNTRQVADILTKHLSPAGKITPMIERNLIVVEEQPAYMERIQNLLAHIDVEPRQILIEARILEITLDKSESFGVDWSRVFGSSGNSSVGTTGLAQRGTAGLFLNIVSGRLDVFLSALASRGRVRTLSTPRLLALENQEASTVIGDRIGYKVTTTTNQITTESVQFLDTGVILRVTPAVDQRGRIMLNIHPEVSSASISAGVPSKKSTEVTTQLLCDDGQAVFIGGLIKSNTTTRRTGVPGLGELPAVGRLFSASEELVSTTETVVVITPRIVSGGAAAADPALLGEMEDIRRAAVPPPAPVADVLPQGPAQPATDPSR